MTYPFANLFILRPVQPPDCLAQRFDRIAWSSRPLAAKEVHICR